MHFCTKFFIMLYIKDFSMHHYVGFSQIESHIRGGRDAGVRRVVETKKKDDTIVEFIVAMTCTCTHKYSTTRPR